ncbi:MAG: CpXC domain-containing protein [Candidatus Promineifilaceae bacterium]
MPHSVAQITTLTCPTCGLAFPAQLWVIVDGDERPDLLARVRNGTLQQIACPRDHLLQVDAPLLLYLPAHSRPLLFSPAQDTNSEQDRQQAERFLVALRGSLGEKWQDEWLTGGLSTVPRAALPAFLSDDPEAALADLMQQQVKQLSPALREAFDEVLVVLALDGVNFTAEGELEKALAARPDLRAHLQQIAAAETSTG